jgi:hypothetical protein
MPIVDGAAPTSHMPKARWNANRYGKRMARESTPNVMYDEAIDEDVNSYATIDAAVGGSDKCRIRSKRRAICGICCGSHLNCRVVHVACIFAIKRVKC